MTSTAGAFVSNAASRAHTLEAFAKNATSGTVSAVTRCFASVHAVASRFSQHVATLSIAHGLAECAHATLLCLRKNARDAPAGAPEWRRSAERCGWLGIEARLSLLERIIPSFDSKRAKTALDLAGYPGREVRDIRI